MLFRLSQKLCTKIKAGKLIEMPLDANPFADWSANFFVANRTQYFILSNTKSLYSCVMLAKGITSTGQFIERALGCIREFMESDGQKSVYRKFIAPSIPAGGFAKALNRTVTGSMNELTKFAELWLAEGDSPHEVGIKLNDVLLSALATDKSRGYGKPKEAFKELVSSIKVKSGDIQKKKVLHLNSQYVRDRLEELAKKDTERKVFGSSSHGYRLNPPLAANKIAAFEAEHGMTLPEDYRFFITEIGNGGAGPFYGLFPFGHYDEGPWRSGVLVGDVGKPFPHTKAWNLGDDFWAKEPDFSEALSEEENKRRSKKWNQLLSAKYWTPKVVNGALPVCHIGCLLRQWLVVHGPQRGFVWTDYRFDCQGLFPLKDKKGKQMTFTDWYLDWLKKPDMRAPTAPRG